MTRVPALVLAVALALGVPGCQCGFDDGKLADLACGSDRDCRPDQDCLQDTCTQRPCSEAADCGPRAQFGCFEGFCVAEGCDTARPCDPGFECRGGLCVQPLPDGGVDGGVDASVPCGDPAECDDRLECTDDACADGFCTNVPRAGTCAIDGACWAAGDATPDNPCGRCDPASAATRWTADDAAIPSDAIDCTVDRCEGGVAAHAPDDALCGAGRVCSACAGGCIDPPILSVACPDLPGATGGAPVSCTVSAAVALPGADDCVTCTSVVGMTSLVRDDFEGCPALADLGWQGNLAGANCPGPNRLGPDPDRAEGQLVLGSRQTSLERWVDTTGFDAARLCFDLAQDNWQDTSTVAVELNTTGVWSQVWTSDALAAVEEAWQNVCLDLVALDPMAADNPALGARFRPDDLAGHWGGGDVYLDNVAVDAWTARTVSWPGRVASDDFAGCVLDDWTAAGAPVSCPVGFFVEAAGAAQGSWTLSRDLDLSTRCDGLRLGFSMMSVSPDGDDSLSVSIDRGAGPLVVWGIERGPYPEGQLLPFEVSLSHVDPTARLHPRVNLSFAAASVGAGDVVAIDDVWLDGAECAAAPDLVSAGPAVPDAGGWTVAVTGNVRATAYVECSWEGRPETLVADSVQFCPDAECSPGTRESQACGECGQQARLCDTDCRWLDWSPCADYPCSCCDPYGGCSACCC